MKRNRLLMKSGALILTAIVSVAILLTSCLKDNGPGSIDFSKSPALVGFQYHAGSATPLTTKLLGHADDFIEVEVTLSVASITLKSPVIVNIAADDAGANHYITKVDTNEDGTPKDHLLPASDYTIENGGKVTINAGQQFAKIKVSFKGDQIDFDQNFIMGLKITSADGALVASNLKNALLVLTLQSPYEGVYSMNSYVFRDGDAVLTGNFQGFIESVNTITKTTVSLTQVWANESGVAGIDGLNMTVNPTTNKVTVQSPSNANLGNDPAYDNRYDPATKTFYVSFKWTTPAQRAATDTLTFVRPL